MRCLGTVMVLGLIVVGCDDGTVTVAPERSPTVIGSGSCLNMPRPTKCFRDQKPPYEATCGVDGKGNLVSQGGETIPPSPAGCVGALMVFEPGLEPKFENQPIGVWVAPKAPQPRAFE